MTNGGYCKVLMKIVNISIVFFTGKYMIYVLYTYYITLGFCGTSLAAWLKHQEETLPRLPVCIFIQLNAVNAVPMSKAYINGLV